MNEIVKYSRKNNVETLRLLKNDKDITHVFEIHEFKNKCNFNFPDVKICGINLGNWWKYPLQHILCKNAVQIHTHPAPLPLSMPDIMFALRFRVKKIIAVTADGNYSVVDCQKVKNRRELISNLCKLTEKLRMFIAGKGDDAVMGDLEVLKKYRADLQNLYAELAQKHGFVYRSSI